MSWGIANPFSDTCVAGAVQNSDRRMRLSLKRILANSEAVFGVELRPMNSEGGVVATNQIASVIKLRTEGNHNYLTCEQIENVITIADVNSAIMWEVNNEDCGNLEFNCLCNSRWNAKAHEHISDHLTTALVFAQESADLENCETLAAQAFATELYGFVESLYSENVDVSADNKKMLLTMVGTSVLIIGGLMLMTKGK